MIALTGATGFVGIAVLRTASSLGLPIRSLVRTTLSEAVPEGIVVGDLAGGLDPGTLAGATSVIHAAARAHVMRETATDAEAAFQIANCQAAMQVARAAVESGVPRMVFVSTIKVLGEGTTTHPFTPDDPLHPTDPYARSKAAAEERLQKCAVDRGLELVIVRPPLVYGPGARGNLEMLIRLVSRGMPLPLGAIRNRRSMVAVDALAELLLVAATGTRPPQTVYHAADQNPVSTPDLVRAIAKGLDRPARLLHVPKALLSGLGGLVGRTAVVERLCNSLEVDATATERDFPWLAPRDTLDGIARMAAAFR